MFDIIWLFKFKVFLSFAKSWNPKLNLIFHYKRLRLKEGLEFKINKKRKLLWDKTDSEHFRLI